MAIIYKVLKMRKDLRDVTSPILYYPRAVTLGRSVRLNYIIENIVADSSLSRGDVKSVLQNFVEKLKEQLLEGKSVNIAGLGVFSVSLKSKGELVKEDVTAKTVESVKICFRAHKDLRITKSETRANEKVYLVSLDDYTTVDEGGETDPGDNLEF